MEECEYFSSERTDQIYLSVGGKPTTLCSVDACPYNKAKEIDESNFYAEFEGRDGSFVICTTNGLVEKAGLIDSMGASLNDNSGTPEIKNDSNSPNPRKRSF